MVREKDGDFEFVVSVKYFAVTESIAINQASGIIGIIQPEQYLFEMFIT